MARIKSGARKINIDTDDRMAMSGQIRRVLWEDPSNSAWPGAPGACTRPLSVTEMARRYKSGLLDPVLS